MKRYNHLESKADNLYFCKHYDKALECYERSKAKTTHIRRINNKIADCLIQVGQYEKAYEELKNTSPYLMIDEQDSETLRLLAIIAEKRDKDIEARLYSNSYYFFTNTLTDNKKYICDSYKPYDETYKQFLEHNFCDLDKMLREQIELLRLTELSILLSYCTYIGHNIAAPIKDILASERFTFMWQFIRELNSFDRIMLVYDCENENESLRLLSMLKMLQIMKKKVQCYALKDATVYKCFYTVLKNATIIDTLQELAHSLVMCSSDVNYKPILLFANHSILEKIYLHTNGTYKVLEMFYRHYEEQPIKHMDCMLIGNFFQTTSFFYNVDTKILVESVPTIDYSIIIPARNSAKYLKYAILSCLNQDFNGSYEVLISDNSDPENFTIKECVDEINHKRIRYIRTPYVLSLARSFEYAYLMAKGKRLLSIGSDDGLTFYALSTIDKIFQKTQDSIIHFHGFFFMWPENGYQAKLVLYKQTLPDKQKVSSLDMERMRYDMITGQYPFQYLPIMYMHTCVKREHIKKIITKTGKFEFGYSQDVYTGILNSLLEKSITYTNIPIFVGGSSQIGIGASLDNAFRSSKIFSLIQSGYPFKRFENYRFSRVTFAIRTYNEKKFLYEEFKKIQFFRIIDNLNFEYPDKEILEIIKSAYITYPQETNDVNILYKQIFNFAEDQGAAVFNKFLSLEKSINMERNNIARRIKINLKNAIVKKTFIKHLCLHMYALYQNILKKKNKKQLELPYSILTEKIPSIFADCKRENLNNIQDACIWASQWLKNNEQLDI